MRRLIRADVGRVMLKIGFYILPALYLIVNLFDTSSSSKNYGFEDLFSSMSLIYKYAMGYIVCLPVFLGVYGDELKSGALIIAIGRGRSRKMIVIAKFIDAMLLAFVLYVILFATDMFSFVRYMITPTPLQIERAVLLMVSAYLKSVGAMGFAAIFVYLTWNASAGIVVEIISLAFAETALKWIQDHLRIPALDFSLIGQVDQACANFAAGKNWIFPTAVMIAYLAAFVLISIALFYRKELEL